MELPAFFRKYLWLLVILGMIFVSVVISVIFFLINKCLSKRGKHRIAHIQKRPVFPVESNKYQETNLVNACPPGTPPLPPRTQFLTAAAQSYENLAETPGYQHEDEQDAGNYEKPTSDAEEDKHDYEEAEPDYEQDHSSYVQPTLDAEEDEHDYEEAEPEYEQDLNNYKLPTPDYEQDEHDYEESQPEYEQDLNNHEQPIPDYDQDEHDYEESQPEYEQDLNNHEQPIPDYDQDEHDYEESQADYEEVTEEQPDYVKVEPNEEVLPPPPPPQFMDPGEDGDSEDYDDIGGDDEDQEDDYDDVA